eukprot:TRINITY_DN6810_c0_g1_i3.p1 TRINITY_DN6810_c0_g1~~TRINITY_DN6810_c0_g1_i3.p1  ORF type:complete len:373 (+),score=60.90 TRINITY_DN6810_c0_g1_i3:63-1181(+)
MCIRDRYLTLLGKNEIMFLRLEEGRQLLDQAKRELEKSPNHPSRTYLLGEVELVYGQYYINKHSFAEALNHLQEGLSLIEKTLGKDASNMSEYKEGKMSLAVVYAETGRLQDSVKIYDEIIQMATPPLQEKDEEVPNAHLWKGITYLRHQQLDTAKQCFEQAIQTSMEIRKQGNTGVCMHSHMYMGMLFNFKKDFTTAKTHLLTSREVLKNIGFGNIPVLVQILNNLLNSLEGLEQWEEADTYSGELCDTLDKLEGGKGGDLAMAYLRHALIKDKLKKDAESADCARKSNKILEGINNPAKDPYVLKNLLLISQSLASEKKFQEMLDITKNQALPLALKLYGKDDRASLFWVHYRVIQACLLYTSPSPRDQA